MSISPGRGTVPGEQHRLLSNYIRAEYWSIDGPTTEQTKEMRAGETLCTEVPGEMKAG